MNCMVQYLQIGDNMSETLTKYGKCSGCGALYKYGVYNVDEQINLENFNLFKNPMLHVCNNCGYVFYDLDTQYHPIQKVDNVKFSKEPKSLFLASKLLETDLPPEIKLRLYACIFDNRKLKLTKKIKAYLEDPSDEDKQKLFEFKKGFKKFCENFLNFLSKNNFDLKDNQKIFVKLLTAEILCAIGKTDQAERLLEDLNLEKRLGDFMKEAVMIGDMTCCNL